MKRPIIQAPDERLLKISQEVDASELSDLLGPVYSGIRDLQDTFRATQKCIGLAAPQIGIPWRIIIVDVSPSRSDTYVMVNPVIAKESEDLQVVRDGCMSVSNGQRFLDTKRPRKLTIQWIDPDGTLRRQKFSGLTAACVHHEVDHLNGVLFIDRVV